MGKFFISLLIASAVIVALVFLGTTREMINKPTFLFETTVFLFFGTSVVFVYLYRVNHQIFVQLYLLSMVVKLIAYGGYNFFMIMTDRKGALGNVTLFMVMYFVFTWLEIAFLYEKISRHPKP
ncbi:MAG: hypothetical protein ACOYXT_04880 [Bacteroidota bacterium]